MPHLLQIHIGPVQTFIATARRSRDLWFGSWLLSELSKAAARAIADTEGLDALIFPAPASLTDLDPQSDLNVANKIVAVVADSPSGVAGKARAAVDDRLAALRDATLTDLKAHLVDWKTVEEQIAGFHEFYWVAAPLGEDNYKAARELADALLAARKNTRSFGPVTWGSNQPKSSLDGARESVIPKEQFSPDEMYELFHARPGEQLSAVDLLKRLGKRRDEDEHFPSTSHMAALPMERQLRERGNATAWNDYLDTLPRAVVKDERAYVRLRLPVLNEADGSLLFGARLTDYLTDKKKREEAAAALKRFFEKSKDKQGDALEYPDPYYALLAGDGDSVGETINRLTTRQGNQKFSRALAGFANEARQIIAKHSGATIYAGGDDVLALLPVHTALRCAAEVAGAFRQAMAECGAAGEPPTFSAGLVIVHHLDPLEDALALAREAEQRAKKVPGKNALAVTLDKRSGVPRTVAGRWDMAADVIGLDERLLSLAELHQARAIPDRLAYQLRDMALRLEGDEPLSPEAQAKLDKIIIGEAKRIVSRKREEGGENKLLDKNQQLLNDLLAQYQDVRSLADELVIAAHIAKVSTLALLTPRGEPLKEVPVA